MFREMRRSKQALSHEEMINLIKSEKRGVLAVNGDDGYPYAMPMNHFYDEESGKLYFHGSRVGHRLDSLRVNPKLCYTIYGQDYQTDGDWAKFVKSVIIFGRARVIEDAKELTWCVKIAGKFPCPPEYIEKLTSGSGAMPLFYEIEIESMTGKLVHEA